MAFAVVAHVGKAGTQNGVTSDAIDTTGANLIVLIVTYYNGVGGSVMAAGTHVTDSKGNTWTPRTDYTPGGSSVGHVRLFYCYAPTVGSGHTFTANNSSGGGTFPSLFALAVSGSVTSPYDVENGSGATGSPGSITPTEDNELVVSGVYHLQATGTPSINSGMTLSDFTLLASGVNVGGALAYKIQTTAAAISPAWTATTGGPSDIASFKAAPVAQTATSGTVAITVSASNPTIAVGSVSCSSGTGTVTVSGSNPNLSVGSVSLTSGTVSVQSLVTNPQTAVGPVSLTSGVGLVSLSANNPSTVVGSLSLTSGTVSITALVSSPDLSVGGVVLNSGTGAITTTVNSPDVLAGGVSASSGAITVSVLGISPDIVSGSISLSSGTAEIQITGVNPSIVSQPVLITAGVGIVVVGVVNVETIKGAVSVVPGVVSITIVGLNASASTPSNSVGFPESTWNRGYWQVIRVFSARLSYKRVWSARIPPVRVVKKDGALQRTCSRPINHPNRVWSYNNMSLAKETLYKYTVEEKTFGADYSDEGALKGGETIVSGTVSISPSSGTPPSAGTVEVITSKFTDSDGKVIMPYKGLKCRLTGGDAATRVVTFLATTSGGDKLAIPGKLVIEDPTA